MRSGAQLTLIGVIVFTVSLCAATPASAQYSLITLARQRDGTAGVVVDVDGPVDTIESIAPESEIIVRGIVRAQGAAMSSDETRVYTEYEIVPTRFYRGSLPSLSRPGPPPPMIVGLPGGTLTIDGLTLSTSINIFPAAEMPRVGEDLILFVSTGPTGRYCVIFGEGAVFRVVDGQVVGLTRRARAAQGDKPEPLVTFEERLRKALLKMQG